MEAATGFRTYRHQTSDAMGATLLDYIADLHEEGCFFLPSWSEKVHFSAGVTQAAYPIAEVRIDGSKIWDAE